MQGPSESPPSVGEQAELHGLDAVKDFSLELDAALLCFLISVQESQLTVAMVSLTK